MTNKQKVFGGIGVAIILLLVFVRRVKAAPVLEEEVVMYDENGEEKSTSGGGGFGGGVTPVNVAPAPTTVVLPVQPIVTAAPTMNLAAPTAPYAIGSTATDAPPTSTVTESRATPPPAPSTPAATRPIAAPVKDAVAVKFTNFLDFDGISQKSKMDLLL